MTSRQEDSAVRGFVYAIGAALAAWAMLALALIALVTLLPGWALVIVAAALLLMGVASLPAAVFHKTIQLSKKQ